VASITTVGPERVRAIPRYLVTSFFFSGGGATFLRLSRLGDCSDHSMNSAKIH
jgi:hypothetical protein